jgi:hypothetical protein
MAAFIGTKEKDALVHMHDPTTRTIQNLLDDGLITETGDGGYELTVSGRITRRVLLERNPTPAFDASYQNIGVVVHADGTSTLSITRLSPEQLREYAHGTGIWSTLGEEIINHLDNMASAGEALHLPKKD